MLQLSQVRTETHLQQTQRRSSDQLHFSNSWVVIYWNQTTRTISMHIFNYQFQVDVMCFSVCHIIDNTVCDRNDFVRVCLLVKLFSFFLPLRELYFCFLNEHGHLIDFVWALWNKHIKKSLSLSLSLSLYMSHAHDSWSHEAWRRSSDCDQGMQWCGSAMCRLPTLAMTTPRPRPSGRAMTFTLSSEEALCGYRLRSSSRRIGRRLWKNRRSTGETGTRPHSHALFGSSPTPSWRRWIVSRCNRHYHYYHGYASIHRCVQRPMCPLTDVYRPMCIHFQTRSYDPISCYWNSVERTNEIAYHTCHPA